MWSDTQLLLLILAALYFGECLIWVPAQGLLLTASGRRWRTRAADGGLGNGKGTYLPYSLPPWSHRGLLWVPCGFSCGPEGVVSFLSNQPGKRPRPSQPSLFLNWKQVEELTRSEKTLLHEERVFLIARNETTARRQLSLLKSLASAPTAERIERLQAVLRAPLDSAVAKTRLTAARAAARPVSLLAALLFTYCFGVAPAIGTVFGVQRTLVWLFAGALVFHVPLLALFFRAHRALAPDRRGERWTEFAKILLSPPMAMRAPDTLWLHALDGLHPLAALAAEGAREESRRLGRILLLDVRHPLGLEECPAGAAATEAWHRNAWGEGLSQLLREQSIDPDRLTLPPETWEEGVAGYCCRCQQGYGTTSGICTDCRLPLQPVVAPVGAS